MLIDMNKSFTKLLATYAVGGCPLLLRIQVHQKLQLISILVIINDDVALSRIRNYRFNCLFRMCIIGKVAKVLVKRVRRVQVGARQ